MSKYPGSPGEIPFNIEIALSLHVIIFSFVHKSLRNIMLHFANGLLPTQSGPSD